MSNYPDGMTRADLIAVGEIDAPREPIPDRVLVVTLAFTFIDHGDEFEEDADVHLSMSPREFAEAVARDIRRTPPRHQPGPDKVEVWDYNWEEAQ